MDIAETGTREKQKRKNKMLEQYQRLSPMARSVLWLTITIVLFSYIWVVEPFTHAQFATDNLVETDSMQVYNHSQVVRIHLEGLYIHVFPISTSCEDSAIGIYKYVSALNEWQSIVPFNASTCTKTIIYGQVDRMFTWNQTTYDPLADTWEHAGNGLYKAHIRIFNQFHTLKFAIQ